MLMMSTDKGCFFVTGIALHICDMYYHGEYCVSLICFLVDSQSELWRKHTTLIAPLAFISDSSSKRIAVSSWGTLINMHHMP